MLIRRSENGTLSGPRAVARDDRPGVTDADGYDIRGQGLMTPGHQPSADLLGL